MIITFTSEDGRTQLDSADMPMPPRVGEHWGIGPGAMGPKGIYPILEVSYYTANDRTWIAAACILGKIKYTVPDG